MASLDYRRFYIVLNRAFCNRTRYFVMAGARQYRAGSSAKPPFWPIHSEPPDGA
jgi:hypothetical protein